MKMNVTYSRNYAFAITAVKVTPPDGSSVKLQSLLLQ